MIMLILLLIAGIGLFAFSAGIKVEEKVKTEDGEAIEVNKKNKFIKLILRIVSVALIFLGVLSTSFVYIAKGESGHLTKKAFGSSLTDGRIIATDGEMGRQARVLSEGLKFELLINVLYDVEKFKNIIIKPSQVGLITTTDGLPLGKNEFIAKDWVKTSQESQRTVVESKMLDAKFFLENKGQKGPQLNVLKPGEHRVNQYLYKIKVVNATEIKAGEVGVITSKVGKIYEDIETSADNGELAKQLVPKGYIGVWKDVLTAGTYYLNTLAYKVDVFDTRIQTWRYKGGYTSRSIEVSLNANGEVVQKAKEEKIIIPKNAADKAIDIKTKDGWVIFSEARMQIQAEPKYAPYIIASIGSLEKMEDRVITPIFRSMLRNIGESKKAVSFLNNRSKIENEVENLIKKEARKAGVTVKDVRITHINIPPALMVPMKRKQLAQQMQETYKEEKAQYLKQIESNKARAQADQQPELVKAEIRKKRAAEIKEEKRLLGEGEKLYLTQVAEGQRAQVKVLGEDRTYELQMWEKTLNAIKENPEVYKNVPTVYINKSGRGADSGSDFAEGAAIFNLQQIKKSQQNITNGRTRTNSK